MKLERQRICQPCRLEKNASLIVIVLVTLMACLSVVTVAFRSARGYSGIHVFTNQRFTKTFIHSQSSHLLCETAGSRFRNVLGFHRQDGRLRTVSDETAVLNREENRRENEKDIDSLLATEGYNDEFGSGDNQVISGPLLDFTTLVSPTRSKSLPPSLDGLTPGSNEGFYIIRTYKTNPGGFDLEKVSTLVEEKDFERLEVTSQNLTVPLALMMLDPDEYPSLSRARKACRKANILIHRGPLKKDSSGQEAAFDATMCQRARVGDRVFPGDLLAKQVRVGDGYFPVMNHKKPPFELPVVYEDDHFAIGTVNKPAGVVVYAHRKAGHGVMTVRSALPFTVQPPKPGTFSTLRRPQPVHRLDKPTSGLLIIAKTKPAMIHLSHQFRDRKVKKTYVAIVNGIPQEPPETEKSAEEAFRLGVDVAATSTDMWQVIDHALEGKSAISVWRAVKYSKSLKANYDHLTLVELKPKTGRYHQLRRHMAWVCECPIVGDSDYDGGGSAMQLRERGLFLCSIRVTLEHPFYNDLEEAPEVIFQRLSPDEREFLWLSYNQRIMLTATIKIPEKFESFMQHEDDRFRKMTSE